MDQIFALEQQLAVGDSIILNHEEYIISGVGAVSYTHLPISEIIPMAVKLLLIPGAV